MGDTSVGMVVEAQRPPSETLARAAARLADGDASREALELMAGAVRDGTGARLVAVRLLDEETGLFVVRAAAPAGSTGAAERSGSRRTADELLAAGVETFPARFAGRLLGALELDGPAGGLDAEGRALAELAAAQLGLWLGTRTAPGARRAGPAPPEAAALELERAGDALAAGADAAHAAHQAVRIAADLTRAGAAAIWRATGGAPEPVAQCGDWPSPVLERGRSAAAEALAARESLLAGRDPEGGALVVSLHLGQPAFGVLQLRYTEEPAQVELEALASFAVRVAHALRLGERAREMELERDRTRALLSVVGEATARLSVAHTLETVIERVVELLGLERAGIYLREEGRLVAAADRNLPPGHEALAFGLLELALGPLRARDAIEVRRDSAGPAARVARALAGSGVEAVAAVPLRLGDETIGLLVAYNGPAPVSDHDRALLGSLAAQLAVAVQNARLHERTKELGDALGEVLEAERQAATRLHAQYTISSSFATSLSLERTMSTVTSAAVEALGVDAASIAVPDARGGTLEPRAVHVAGGRSAEALRAILERPQPIGAPLEKPILLGPRSARRRGGAHALLEPFLARGATAAVLPIASPTELLAVLTIVSLDPDRPIDKETVSTAFTIAAQSALAIDNARLYSQQRAFAETIQHALLPRTLPDVPGLELGVVYQSASRVDVGGDLYDFLELGDGRLAVVVGDVIGHGVDATADMAMVKFVFRSLAREHPDPSDLLARANDVVAEEIASGKFITMVSITIDSSGTIAAASAGHPAPRLVLPEGRVEPVDCAGLALGIDQAQSYRETRAELPPGGSVVLFTDGVLEARSGGEQYGLERLDALLAERSALPAQQLAEAVLDDCRAYTGGELSDDCAVLVVRRT